MAGTGYVGLVTGACLAQTGHFVTCVDTDSAKVKSLKKGAIPFYEPGLAEMVRGNVREKRLAFTTRLADAAKQAEVFFIAVGTPAALNGSSDMRYVLAVAAELGRCLSRPATIVAKSTSPVGTAERIRKVVQRELKKRGVQVDFDMVSNPEFLKEGDAIKDFMRPDRVIIGVENQRAANRMRELYSPIIRAHEQLLVMGVRDAELTKYAANTMLASRISLMNEIANLCEKVGVDVENVRQGIGSDRRIGYSFIYPGCGYGGSCFPKDTMALVRTAQEIGAPTRIVETVAAVNAARKRAMATKVLDACGGSVAGKTIALLGLAFKPNTDDMREAPAIDIVSALGALGARVRAYDPASMEQARPLMPNVEFAIDAYACVDGADALVIVTEWDEFRALDLDRVRAALKAPVVVDLRNIYRPGEMRRRGFRYSSVGRG